MTSRARLAAHVVLLLVALLPIAGVVAGLAGCEDDCASDCSADCGDCMLCSPAGHFAASVTLAPLPSGALSFTADVASASAIDSRAIEHVPLRLA